MLANARNGSELGPLELPGGQPRCLRFSPDGVTIACGNSQQELLLLNARTRQLWPWGRLTEHAGSPGRLAFSPDGRRLASGDDQGVVKVWRLPEDPASHQEPLRSERTFEMPSLIHCVAFSPDGKRVAAGYAQTQVWDVPSGRKPLELEGQEASFSPDGLLLATGGGSLDTNAVIWNAQTGKQHVKLEGGHNAGITCVLFYDARHVITGDHSGRLRCWNVETGELLKRFEGLRSP